MRVLDLIVLFGAAVLVAGCGGGSSDESKSKASAEGAIPKGIYVSAGDCADSGFLEYDVCDEQVEKAIVVHNTESPAYTSLAECEAKEGDDRCERALDSKFRARLLAFEITGGESPTAKPLYPGRKGEAGFRDLGGAIILHKDFEVPFSPQAVAAFQPYARGF